MLEEVRVYRFIFSYDGENYHFRRISVKCEPKSWLVEKASRSSEELLISNEHKETKRKKLWSSHRRGWHCRASRARPSQSACLLRCRRRGSRREPGNRPRRRTESCRHGNQRRRRSWCRPPSPRSWSPSTAPPERETTEQRVNFSPPTSTMWVFLKACQRVSCRVALWSDLEGERRDGLPHVEGLSDRSLGVLLSHFRGEVGNAAGSRNRNIIEPHTVWTRPRGTV